MHAGAVFAGVHWVDRTLVGALQSWKGKAFFCTLHSRECRDRWAGGEACSPISGTGPRGAPIDTCVRLTSTGRQLWKGGLWSSVGVAVEPAVMGMSLGCLHAARARWVFATHRMACG